MLIKLFFLILYLILLNFHSSLVFGDCEFSGIVETDKGPVVGEIKRTILNSIPYASFRGIPYGKPPIGALRFQPPEAVEPWEGTLNATSEGNECPQIDFVYNIYGGNEDCLYLNVYTPKTNFNEDTPTELLPVMIWIGGGMYKKGNANQSFYGPDFIIENDVIMVAPNFRLGVLGFLALNIPEATGNLQLKDQVQVLKWVKKNIEKFGGDPNKITLFGLSTGGVCIDLHMISDASRGLFHRTISMSSPLWSAWAFSTPSQAEERAFRLGEGLGIHTNDKKILLQEFMKKSAEELVIATEKLTHVDREFKPTIENINVAGDNAFLTECPIRKFKNGDFAKVPHITGFMKNEVLSFAQNPKNLYYYTKLALDQLDHQNIPMKYTLISLKNELSNYLPKNITEVPIPLVMNVINNVTDVLYKAVIDQKQKLLSKSSTVYCYQNSYDAGKYSYHQIRAHVHENLHGAGHADDMFYLFYISVYDLPLDPNLPLSIIREKIVRLFTNFARYGNPTPDSTDSLLNITWPSSGDSGKYLEINEKQWTVNDNPIDESVQQLEKDLSGSVWDEFNGCSSYT